MSTSLQYRLPKQMPKTNQGYVGEMSDLLHLVGAVSVYKVHRSKNDSFNIPHLENKTKLSCIVRGIQILLSRKFSIDISILEIFYGLNNGGYCKFSKYISVTL